MHQFQSGKVIDNCKPGTGGWGLRQEDQEYKASLSSIARPSLKKSITFARHWWLTPVILATQEADIRRIEF
jgi:hypothetical protein